MMHRPTEAAFGGNRDELSPAQRAEKRRTRAEIAGALETYRRRRIVAARMRRWEAQEINQVARLMRRLQPRAR